MEKEVGAGGAVGQRKRQNERGKALSRPRAGSVGNRNHFKIAKWYSLGIKIKDKQLQRAKSWNSFFIRKTQEDFFFPFIKYLSKER